MIRFTQLICLFLLTNISVVMADTLDVAKNSQASISLTTHLGILEDVDKTWTFEDIQQNNVEYKTGFSAGESVNLSYTSSAFWVQLKLDNNSDQLIEKVLEVNQPLLEYLDFYWQIQNKTFDVINTGYARPFENRPYKTRVFAFPLQLPAHSQNIIYLRIASPNAIILPMRLWKPENFQVKDRKDHIFQGLYFGILFSIALFSLGMSLVIKEVNYAIYVSIILFMGMGFITFRGLGAEFIWQDYPELTKVGSLFFSTLATIAQLFFVSRILDIRNMFPWLDRIITGLIFIQFCMAIFVVTFFTLIVKYTASFFVFYPIFSFKYKFFSGYQTKTECLVFICWIFSSCNWIYNQCIASPRIITNEYFYNL